MDGGRLMKVNIMKAFKKKKILRTYVLSLLIVILMLAAIVYDYDKNGTSAAVIEGLSDSLIRFHVIANSDSEEDQELKLKVRDEILDKMNDILSESKNIEETRKIICDNKEYIKEIAKRVVEENNYDYDIDVMLKMEQFPLKTYGDIILPPGEYEALLVKIGQAKGKNWWCVMFPPLCFVDVTHGVVPQETKETLKRVLTDEEYDSVVMAETQEDMPIKIRFKFLEWFNLNKNKDRERKNNRDKVFVNRN